MIRMQISEIFIGKFEYTTYASTPAIFSNCAIDVITKTLAQHFRHVTCTHPPL
jgi:hypothetical protein